MNSWPLTIGGLLLLAGGCSLTGGYVTQDHLDRVPRMTCDQLAQNGTPADKQVILTDLRLAGAGIVATRHDGHLEVCIPVYPAIRNQEPQPAEMAFLLRVWGDEDWRRIKEQPGAIEVNCWAERPASYAPVAQSPRDLEGWAWNGLGTKYPGIRLDTIWLLTVGHGATPTAEKVRTRSAMESRNS